jgi:hypothetical protein
MLRRFILALAVVSPTSALLAGETLSLNALAIRPDVGLDVTAPSRFRSGAPIGQGIRIVVRNLGAATVSNVTLALTLERRRPGASPDDGPAPEPGSRWTYREAEARPAAWREQEVVVQPPPGDDPISWVVGRRTLSGTDDAEFVHPRDETTVALTHPLRPERRDDLRQVLIQTVVDLPAEDELAVPLPPGLRLPRYLAPGAWFLAATVARRPDDLTPWEILAREIRPVLVTR